MEKNFEEHLCSLNLSVTQRKGWEGGGGKEVTKGRGEKEGGGRREGNKKRNTFGHMLYIYKPWGLYAKWTMLITKTKLFGFFYKGPLYSVVIKL